MLRSLAHSALRRTLRVASQRTTLKLVSSGGERGGKVSLFTQRFKVGKHTLAATEPQQVGGREQAAALVTRLTPKESELGAGFVVQRLLPAAAKRAVGPWLFCDHFGPVDVSGAEGAAQPMDVGPHPHIGVATVSYLLSGAILHRDSTGVQQLIVPGQVNYMSSGRGVVHSERGREALPHFPPHPQAKKILHGLQMWLGVPREHEDDAPSFHHAPAVVDISSGVVVSGSGRADLVAGRVGLAEMAAIPQLWPLFMLTLHLEPGAVARIPLQPAHEACVFACLGQVEAGAEQSVLDTGESAVYATAEGAEGEVAVRAGDAPCVVAVFGGLPLPEPRHLYWNFGHSERRKVQEAAEAWRRLDRAVFPPVVNEANTDSIPLPPRRSR